MPLLAYSPPGDRGAYHRSHRRARLDGTPVLSGAFAPQAITNPWRATPFIFAGLAVAVGFKCGLFNIGAEGQLAMGAMSAAVAGFAFTGLPIVVHMIVAVLAGFLGGAAWGAIPGCLRGKTGAHEVITTIMLNYIAIRLTATSSGARRGPASSARARPNRAGRRLPKLLAGLRLLRLHSTLMVESSGGSYRIPPWLRDSHRPVPPNAHIRS